MTTTLSYSSFTFYIKASSLFAPSSTLRSPPPASDSPAGFRPDVTVFRFPEWFIVQHTVTTPAGHRRRRLVNFLALDGMQYRNYDGNKVKVVPVRFVRACERGHVGDIDWFAFVHGGAGNPCRSDLWLEERGTTGDLDEVWVACDCGLDRAMSQAARRDLRALGSCNGSRPWLGQGTKEACGSSNRLLIRSASNAYFPQLPSATLSALADAFEGGRLSVTVSEGAVAEIAGSSSAAVTVELQELLSRSGGAKAVSLILRTIVETRERASNPSFLFDLVLSGPEVEGVPTCDTGAVMSRLVQDARKSLLLVGYAIYNGAKLFQPLAKRMASDPDLQVTFCLDIQRRFGDTSLDSEIIRRFAIEFRKRHWPWKQVPKLLFDPRSLSGDSKQRSSMHAKVIVADESIALISSANLTEAAQKRNIEAGVLIKHAPLAKRVADYFQALENDGMLLLFELPRGS